MKRDTKWTPAFSWLAGVLGLALGGVFFYAGLQKRLEPYQFAEAILAYDLLPVFLVGLVAAILPWLELATGFFLILGYLLEIPGRLLRWLGFSWGDSLVGGIKRRSCLLLIIGQLGLILLVLFITLARGLRIDCGCGLLWARQVGWNIILEDVVLLALAAFLFWWELPGVKAKPSGFRGAIDDFQGDYAFLSNFAPAPVRLNGVQYPTVEHAYQAAKTLEPAEREKIRGASTPGLARKMGRKVAKRPDWPDLKVDLMRDLVRQKFEGQRDLKKSLLATGDAELVEGNTWHDNFWGDCRCARCTSTPGQNWLGRILMDVRRQLQGA
ncbi:MAG: NADAR domain-containing protein [Thermodesulfobacteriota bacterium]